MLNKVIIDNYVFSLSHVDQDLCSLSSRTTHVDSLADLSLKGEQSILDDEDITVFEILDFDRFGFLLDSGTNIFDNLNDEPDVAGESISRTSSLRLFSSDVHLEVSDSSCLSRKDMEFQMKYKRKSAFVLEIMAAGEEHEHQIICDLLEASFQSFSKKKKDYCLFSTLHNLPHFPLFNFFVRAIPKWSTLYPRELYILHKNAIKACLKVRKINRGDYMKVKNLISNMSLSTVLLDTVTKSLFGADKDLKTYVLYDHSVLIGLMVIREEWDLKHYFEYYECYKYIDFAAHRYDRYGLIQFCTLSPLFHKHMQFFLREVHRITDMAILFYLQGKCELSRKTRMKPLAGILKDMIPVLSRSMPNFKNMDMPEVEPPRCTIQKNIHLNYSLYASTRRLCSLPRIEVNNRLVIVGCSSTSTAFLESLISHFDGERHVLFNNLYMIYDRPGRNPVELPYYKYIPLMFLYRGKHGITNNSASFRSHANYIQGFMTAIDRKMKYITINQEVILPYDYLFLMCGTQYHQPYAPGVRKDKVTEPCPENVCVINNYCDAERAFRKLYEHVSHKKTRPTTIVVYGSDIQVYACLCVLDKMHLPQTSIKFVEPIPDENERPSMDPFNNPAIYDAFHDILFLTGIEVHTGYYFFEWEVDPKENIVHHVKYQSRKGAIFFNCDFIFHYANREVKHETFSAVNNAGLVYDGKLVISPDGRTNDPNIYAAGPMTKYSRRYFANRFSHKYYRSSEIGERMGKQIRAKLLPGGLEANKGDEIFNILDKSDTNKLVPQYTEPVVISCMLPGKINYFEIRNPGKPIPLETQKNIGVSFETGSLKKIELDDDPEYFRIAFGKNNRVKEICCFTRRDIEVQNYEKLWGQHEQCLNNLYARFKKGMIKNFYEYFKNPEFCAIYLDRFSELQNKLKKIMALLSNEKGKSMIEDIVKRLEQCNWSKLTAAQEAIVKRKFINSPYQNKMIQEIMKFLETNNDYLPMYAHPLITNMILYDVESSPLFQGGVDINSSMGSYGD